MSPRDQSHTFVPGAARHKARAAVKAHPIAAALGILTLALAILAAAREPQPTSRPHPGVVGNHAATPEGFVPTVPASSGSAAAHGPQARSAATARRERQRRVSAAHEQRTGRALWPRAALNAARRFLSTYLPFTYGQLPARALQAAAPPLRTRIAANPPEVPAAIRRLHPRATALTIIPAQIADAGAGWAATAIVSDGLESYDVTVKLGQQHGQSLVTAILAA